MASDETAASPPNLFDPAVSACPHAIYRELYALYSELHDAFGSPSGALQHVMKKLLSIRAELTGRHNEERDDDAVGKKPQRHGLQAL